MSIEILIPRIPARAAGTRQIVTKMAEAANSLANAVKVIGARDDLTLKGKAGLLEKEVRTAGAALLRARRQAEYAERKLSQDRARLRAKAIGEAKPTDAEYRTYLRSLDSAERVQKVLKDPAARAAALREPGLSDLSDEALTRALEFAIRENAPAEAAALADSEHALAAHSAAVRMLDRVVEQTPFILSKTGDKLLPFASSREAELWLAKEVPVPHPNVITAVEEVEVDLVEAA